MAEATDMTPEERETLQNLTQQVRAKNPELFRDAVVAPAYRGPIRDLYVTLAFPDGRFTGALWLGSRLFGRDSRSATLASWGEAPGHAAGGWWRMGYTFPPPFPACRSAPDNFKPKGEPIMPETKLTPEELSKRVPMLTRCRFGQVFYGGGRCTGWNDDRGVLVRSWASSGGTFDAWRWEETSKPADYHAIPPLPEECSPEVRARGYRTPEDPPWSPEKGLEPRDYKPRLFRHNNWNWTAYGFGACIVGNTSADIAVERWRADATSLYVQGEYGRFWPGGEPKPADYEDPLTELWRDEATKPDGDEAKLAKLVEQSQAMMPPGWKFVSNASPNVPCGSNRCFAYQIGKGKRTAIYAFGPGDQTESYSGAWCTVRDIGWTCSLHTNWPTDLGVPEPADFRAASEHPQGDLRSLYGILRRPDQEPAPVEAVQPTMTVAQARLDDRVNESLDRELNRQTAARRARFADLRATSVALDRLKNRAAQAAALLAKFPPVDEDHLLPDAPHGLS